MKRTETKFLRMRASLQGSLDVKMPKPPQPDIEEREKGIFYIREGFEKIFEENEILGTGCTGIVRRVTKVSSREQFACKRLKLKDEETVQQTIREFKSMHRLSHPNIVKVYELYIDETRRRIYTIMELVEAREMLQVIRQLGCYSEQVASVIFKQILSAIRYMHEKKVCHRDLKPSNILATEDGKCVKIADFNVSKFARNPNSPLSSKKHKLSDDLEGTIANSSESFFPQNRYPPSDEGHTTIIKRLEDTMPHEGIGKPTISGRSKFSKKNDEQDLRRSIDNDEQTGEPRQEEEQQQQQQNFENSCQTDSNQASQGNSPEQQSQSSSQSSCEQLNSPRKEFTTIPTDSPEVAAQPEDPVLIVQITSQSSPPNSFKIKNSILQNQPLNAISPLGTPLSAPSPNTNSIGHSQEISKLDAHDDSFDAIIYNDEGLNTRLEDYAEHPKRVKQQSLLTRRSGQMSSKWKKVKMWTYTGTVAFCAPEMLGDEEYDEGVDIWSAGVVLYTMLSGNQPFQAEYLQDLIVKIRSADYSMSGNRWDNVSEEAKDLVRKCLILNPAERIKPEQALLHPWITKKQNTSPLALIFFDNFEKPVHRFSKQLQVFNQLGLIPPIQRKTSIDVSMLQDISDKRQSTQMTQIDSISEASPNSSPKQYSRKFESPERLLVLKRLSNQNIESLANVSDDCCESSSPSSIEGNCSTKHERNRNTKACNFDENNEKKSQQALESAKTNSSQCLNNLRIKDKVVEEKWKQQQILNRSLENTINLGNISPTIRNLCNIDNEPEEQEQNVKQGSREGDEQESEIRSQISQQQLQQQQSQNDGEPVQVERKFIRTSEKHWKTVIMDDRYRLSEKDKLILLQTADCLSTTSSNDSSSQQQSLTQQQFLQKRQFSLIQQSQE